MFTHGEGVWLYDDSGKRYLDFSSGIAVTCLGHAHPALVKAVQDQAAKLMHTSTSYLSDVTQAFAEKLIEAASGAGMRRVFLANSGAEANEGSIKVARKYSQQKYGPGRHKIVTLKGSFHGRTITSLSATGQDHFHTFFGPFTEGFEYVPANDIAALDKALDPKTTAAFFFEPVQGESGIRPLSREYVDAAAKFCKERDILLMVDEVQSGIGRCGTFLAIEGYGVKPDVASLAKGLSGGVPVGAVLVGEKTEQVLQTGDHGTTFGGNPLAAAAGLVVLDTITKPEFLAEITRKGNKLMDAIRSLNHPHIKDVRGRGLMIGFDIEDNSWSVLEKALDKGLLLLAAGPKTLRLLPPYIITDDDIDACISIIKELV
jgi:acetylornithine/N-succinyldiaminopimelate aminotransferase